MNRSRSRHIALPILVGLLALSLGSASRAQEEEPASDEASDTRPTRGIEEIVITSQGTETPLQEASISVAAFDEQVETLFEDERNNADRIKLIGIRQMRRMNTSSSNSPNLVREATNYAYLSVEDAERIGVVNDDIVEVESESGKIEIPVRVTTEMMPRTVAIPQCWGHKNARGLQHAAQHPGVNSNLLAGDGADNVERLSGMSHLSGILIDVRRLDEGRAGRG